jgi:hypothetical protein
MSQNTLKINVSPPIETKWGFDLTSITAENWGRVLQAVGINKKPKHEDVMWIWSGNGIKIHTGNDPISGKYAQGRREVEKDYASYIGLYGEKALVEKAAKIIRDLADDIKEETPNSSRFI